MASIINIMDRIKDYDCKITPQLEKKVDPKTLKRVQDLLSKMCGLWTDLNLLYCLEYLNGGPKLFQFKELKNENEKTEWNCNTFMNFYFVTAKAPTKMEAYRLILSFILKEFYYFPFDDRMELPTCCIDASKITGNTFDKDVSYPVYKDIVFNGMYKFYSKERAYGYFKKKPDKDVDKYYEPPVMMKSEAESALLHILEAKRIEKFERGQVMIKINQFIWIGSNFRELCLKALNDILDIKINGENKPSEVTNLIEKSMETHSFEIETTTEALDNLVLPD